MRIYGPRSLSLSVQVLCDGVGRRNLDSYAWETRKVSAIAAFVSILHAAESIGLSRYHASLLMADSGSVHFATATFFLPFGSRATQPLRVADLPGSLPI